MNTGKTQNKKHRKNTAISLFAGTGGLDLGFEYLGFDIPVAIEINKIAAYSYSQNFGHKIIDTKTELKDIKENEKVIICDDIRKVSGKFILDICEKITGSRNVDVLLGGPSCQSWSIAGKQLGDNDDRGKMVYEYLRLLQELNPSSFLFENVKGIISKKFISVFENLLELFKNANYDVNYKLLNSFEYGIAQSRERVFIVGIHKELKKKYEFPDPLNYKLVLKDVIGDLPSPKIYNKNDKENEFYIVPKKLIGYKGINHYSRYKQALNVKGEPDYLDIINDRNIGIELIKSGVPIGTNFDIDIKNNMYFDNICLDMKFESANRPINVNKPSHTITAHSRCSHILYPYNHISSDFGYSPRFITRNRQRQWSEASFTIVADCRQTPLHPNPPNYDIRNHFFKEYSKEKEELLSKVPEGGNWTNVKEHLPEGFMQKVSLQSGGKTGFLRKLNLKKPSPTVLSSVEQNLTEFCLPTEKPRRLTVRECMRIQSFPDWFIVYGSLSAQYIQVGNAVPVLVAYHLGKKLEETLKGSE